MTTSTAADAVLGVDTATADTTVAVACGGRVFGERAAGPGEDGRPRHAVALLPQIEAAVEEAGGWERIGRIAVGVGPGTFTGLRIGISTARALAQGRDLTVTPVDSLAALARGIEEAEATPAIAWRCSTRVGASSSRRFMASAANACGSRSSPLPRRSANASPSSPTHRLPPVTARYDFGDRSRLRASTCSPTRTRPTGWRRAMSAPSPKGPRRREPSC